MITAGTRKDTEGQREDHTCPSQSGRVKVQTQAAGTQQRQCSPGTPPVAGRVSEAWVGQTWVVRLCQQQHRKARTVAFGPIQVRRMTRQHFFVHSHSSLGAGREGGECAFNIPFVWQWKIPPQEPPTQEVQRPALEHMTEGPQVTQTN
jgi:hypothetical protein